MTSRLKRKLNDLGVDTASSKTNENFCLIGTPLPPLEKSKDIGEFVPLWKQEVRDEKGRRRLHGAFTGGFSAGYFNTVGSKEGWTPATFVSSRNERAKKKAARPEDFMDEEDLAELRESQKLVDEHEEMDFGGTAAEKGQDSVDQDPITAALAESLAPPPKDSIGAKILKKMGWKVGQGIGPRLTYAQRTAQDAGFLDPAKEVEGNEEDLEEAKKHLYPRKDTPLLLLSRKDNFRGLGYTPGLSLNESVGGERARTDPNISSGFGLGALNDADEDDLDVYDGGPSGRNRVAYDSSLGDDEHHISIGSRASRKQGKPQGPTVPLGITQTQTFNDGTPVLKGFVLSSKPVGEERWFPMPKVPPGWKPDPERVWKQGAEKENQATTKPPPQPARSHAEWKASLLSADERGSMLGEAPAPAKTRSVFEYLSQKDRERLQSFRKPRDDGAAPPSTADAVPPPRPPSPGPPPSAPGGIRVPHLHPSVAKAALSGFQPFTADPLKHSRYTAFLTFQADVASSSSAGPEKLSFGPLPHQSADDFNKELDDYAKSATVFKPLSAAMAGRFRSSAVVEMGPQVVEGLHQPVTYAEEQSGEETKEDKQEEDDPRMGAVRLGMYGRLTRETKPWQPAKLLCKRFGVKEPEVDMTAEAGAATAGFEFATGAAKREAGGAAGPSAETDAGASGAPIAMITAAESASSSGEGQEQRSGPRNLANVGLGEDETQGRDTLTYQRPGMDVFKAIFASDDEDSDDEGEDGGGGDALEATPAPTPLDISAPATTTAKPEAGPTPPPQPPPRPNEPLESIDPATFKPTFIPRSERESRMNKDGKSKKKDKERKKAKVALISFDAEDDGSIPSFGPAPPKEKEKERKKKKRKEKHGEDEDDSMWVEKPAPEVVKTLSAPLGHANGDGMIVDGEGEEKEAGPQRGRKRAIDFM